MSKAQTPSEVNAVDLATTLIDGVDVTLAKAKALTEQAVVEPTAQHWAAAKSYCTRLSKRVEELSQGVALMQAAWKAAQEQPKAEPKLDPAKLALLTKAQLVELLLAEEPEAPQPKAEAKPKPKASKSAKPKRRRRRRTLAAKAASKRTSNQRLEDHPFFEGVSRSFFPTH